MIVYHGSTEEIQKPDVVHSKRYLDFGIAFYVTTFPNQAERWAIRKNMRSGNGKAIVNVYELKEDFEGLRVLKFRDPEDDEAWIDFVCACRDGADSYKEYDIIIGSVANDDVFKSVDMYHRGIWDKERTLQELKYYKKNNQIAIINQKVIAELLEFKSSYIVEVK
jgi:hypothetical protein